MTGTFLLTSFIWSGLLLEPKYFMFHQRQSYCCLQSGSLIVWHNATHNYHSFTCMSGQPGLKLCLLESLLVSIIQLIQAKPIIHGPNQIYFRIAQRLSHWPILLGTTGSFLGVKDKLNTVIAYLKALRLWLFWYFQWFPNL